MPMRTLAPIILLTALVGACAAPEAGSPDPSQDNAASKAASIDGTVAVGARIDVLGST